jgi:murein DD-endopeptidase MepM/ murein hydrolase activator NlpD
MTTPRCAPLTATFAKTWAPLLGLTLMSACGGPGPEADVGTTDSQLTLGPDTEVADVALDHAHEEEEPEDAEGSVPEGGELWTGDMTVPDDAPEEGSSLPPPPPLPAPANCPRARVEVADGGELNVRSGATRAARVLTQLADGYVATVLSAVSGDSVGGTRSWLRVRAGSVEGFASAFYLRCTTAEAPVTQTCPRVEVNVNAGATLNVRSRANRQGAVVAQLADGRVVVTLAAVTGESLGGNDRWYRVRFDGTEGFVFSDFATCTRASATTPASATPPPAGQPVAWRQPLQCGTRARIAQGNNGAYSHQGRTRYAFDYAIPLNTPLTAMRAGRVTYTYKATRPGHRCYGGGGRDCYPHANMVVVKHADGTTSQYKHMNRVDVTVGQLVGAGQKLGLSGSTGYSTGPHAHVMRMTDCGGPNCQSVRVVFADVAGDGIPDRGQTVTSGNCP